jgi:hypothetical protein
MKRLVIEQEILKLPNDNKWEYAVINGVWNAKKIGSSNWINIETNPKVKSQIAINLLNKSFPNAKSKSSLGQTKTNTLDKMTQGISRLSDVNNSLPNKNSKSLSGQSKINNLDKMTQGLLKPLDVNKSIKLLLGNNNTVTLFPNIKDLSSKLIKFLNVDMSKSGNDKSYYIFSDGSDYDTDVCSVGVKLSPKYMEENGVFKINQNYDTPTFNHGTYTEYPKNIKEGNLKLTIKKILKEEIQNKK